MARILVTGSSKGIGRAVVQELVARGHEVIASARKAETLADLNVAKRLALDIQDEKSVAAAVRDAGPIDVLVNNAADFAVAPIETHPLDDVRAIYETNVFGTLRMIQAFAPQMRERGAGTILNVSSVVAKVVFPLGGIYASTKWAIEGLSESLRREIGHFGVRVVLIEPGEIGSGALDAPRAFIDGNNPYVELATSRRRRPKEEMTQPAVVAKAVADAIESKHDVFRWPVGADAEMLIAKRAELDDDAFEKVFRKAVDFNW